jgi:hypothetical protein
MSESCINESKRPWEVTERGATLEQLTLGCLQRIATATELSCKDREKMERDYRYMREDRDRYRSGLETERRRNAALRGQITKLRAAAQLAKGAEK